MQTERDVSKMVGRSIKVHKCRNKTAGVNLEGGERYLLSLIGSDKRGRSHTCEQIARNIVIGCEIAAEV